MRNIWRLAGLRLPKLRRASIFPARLVRTEVTIFIFFAKPAGSTNSTPVLESFELSFPRCLSITRCDYAPYEKPSVEIGATSGSSLIAKLGPFLFLANYLSFSLPPFGLSALILAIGGQDYRRLEMREQERRLGATAHMHPCA